MLSRRFSAFACSCRSAAERLAALAGEHREQREHDGAADRDVQGQHRAREPAGQRRPDRPDELARDPRAEEHDDVRDVPAGRRPDLAEHERPERGEDPPQADAAGGEEPAERDHRQRRREQDVDLAHPEQPREVARAREHGDRTEQDRRSTRAAPHRPAIRTRDTAPPRAPRPGRINTEIRTSSALRARRSSSSWGSAPTSARRAVTRSAAARIRLRVASRRRYSPIPAASAGIRALWFASLAAYETGGADHIGSRLGCSGVRQG